MRVAHALEITDTWISYHVVESLAVAINKEQTEKGFLGKDNWTTHTNLKPLLVIRKSFFPDDTRPFNSSPSWGLVSKYIPLKKKKRSMILNFTSKKKEKKKRKNLNKIKWHFSCNAMQWSGKRNYFLTMWWETVLCRLVSVLC